ncbi:MAG: hypothetical protein HC825_02705 [Oscillatoriales cyanobacterium RM1_1_9]|nr:hypothetical protein [Oscillatoriales cyanobacterium SM2_3_0]NJO45947.1 hypothetical protein [Oscillatoriales cyanobacterium RM2_1_1]NJO70897.1 hypothetical protein [Oscillatoriales cyanobacterium RM1_1_9]
MVLKQASHPITSALVINTLQHSPESLEMTLEITLSQKLSQLQAEIEQLQNIIQELEAAPVFQPPQQLLPLEERFQLHFQSIQIARVQARQLNLAELALKAKQEEQGALQQQLHARRARALKAVKRLESLAQTVKRAEQAYHQVYEEFQGAAHKAQQALIEIYGNDINFELKDSGTTPANLPRTGQFAQLAPVR